MAVNHCGNVGESFNIERGCRHGDAIASYLFILCIEILAHKLRTDPDVKGFNFQISNSGDPNDSLTHLLEIYADDLTIFMHPSDENLQTVIDILYNFYRASGLKISMTKTKAIWFGSKIGCEDRLCPNLGLQWVPSFNLLGVNFDSSLSLMNSNFSNELVKMDRMLSAWAYRYVSPFGKVTIIKSLGLSMLSHLALVLPNPSKDNIKKIESSLFKFLWGGKPDKIRREDTKLLPKHGGLGMPDVANFWTAFKFSWLRRLLQSNSFWPKLFLKTIKDSTNLIITSDEFLQLGSSKISEIAKKLTNPFWRQVLGSVKAITDGMLFSSPHKIISSPFFNNPKIVRKKTVKPTDFPEIEPHFTICHFLYPGTNDLMTWEDFCSRYNSRISRIKFIDIRYIIKSSLQMLRISKSDHIPAAFPQIPLLIDIALSSTKGCSKYYRLLNFKSNLLNKNHLRESKWHLELNQTFSLTFWVKCRYFCSTINYDHSLKWLQYQITRNCLKTNYVVNHFKPEVPPSCSFCKEQDMIEKITHLFWDCSYVRNFILGALQFLSSIGLYISPSKTQFIFGVLDEVSESPTNVMILILKKYIWRQKFTSCTLSLSDLEGYIKIYVSDFKIMYEMQGKSDKFECFNLLYNLLND